MHVLYQNQRRKKDEYREQSLQHSAKQTNFFSFLELDVGACAVNTTDSGMMRFVHIVNTNCLCVQLGKGDLLSGRLAMRSCSYCSRAENERSWSQGTRFSSCFVRKKKRNLGVSLYLRTETLNVLIDLSNKQVSHCKMCLPVPELPVF